MRYGVPEISQNIVNISNIWDSIYVILIQVGLWIGIVNIILALVALIIKIKSSIKYITISLVTTFFIEVLNVENQYIGTTINENYIERGLLDIVPIIIPLIIQIIIFIKLIKEIKKKRRESKDVKNRK